MGRMLALVLALPALVLACGTEGAGSEGSGAGEDEEPATEVVRAAADVAEAAGGARVAVTGSYTSAGIETDVSGEGVVRLDTGDLEMTTTIVLPLVGAQTIEGRVVDGVEYSRWPTGGVLPGPGDGQWIAVDPREALAESGTDPAAFLDDLGPDDLGEGSSASDPAQTVATLRAVEEAEEIGRERVRGVDATRYRGEVDVARVVDEAIADFSELSGAPVDEETRARLVGLAEDSVFVTVEVWIDGDGRPVKIRESTRSVSDHDEVLSEATLELFDYGTAVEVVAPPPEETRDFFDLPDELPGFSGEDPRISQEGPGGTIELPASLVGEQRTATSPAG